MLGRVDGFNQHSPACETDNCRVAGVGLFATHGDTFEPLELADRLFDARDAYIEHRLKTGKKGGNGRFTVRSVAEFLMGTRGGPDFPCLGTFRRKGKGGRALYIVAKYVKKAGIRKKGNLG